MTMDQLAKYHLRTAMMNNKTVVVIKSASESKNKACNYLQSKRSKVNSPSAPSTKMIFKSQLLPMLSTLR